MLLSSHMPLLHFSKQRKEFFISLLFICLFVMHGPSVSAGDEKNVESSNEDSKTTLEDEGITGLIIDNTKTFIGRQFYQEFSQYWLAYQVTENVSIHERPTARSGSQIWVEYNRQRLFDQFLTPVFANIQVTAREAAKSVSRRLKTLQIEKILFPNPDLAPDEF